MSDRVKDPSKQFVYQGDVVSQTSQSHLYLHPDLLQQQRTTHGAFSIYLDADDTVKGNTGMELHRLHLRMDREPKHSHSLLALHNRVGSSLRAMWSDCFKVCGAMLECSNADMVPVVLDNDRKKEVELSVDNPPAGPNASQRLATLVLRAAGLSLSSSSSTLSSSEGVESSQPRTLNVQARTLVEEKVAPLENQPISATQLSALTCLAANAPPSLPLFTDELCKQLEAARLQLRKTVPKIRQAGCVDNGAERALEFDAESIDLWRAYEATVLGLNTEQQLQELSSRLGINEHIEPRQGDALAIVPALACKKWSRSIISDYNPNFHFAYALVVAPEAAVYVTLENWATGNPDEINEHWGFAVYSTPGGDPLETYHSRLTRGGGYGNISISFRCRSPPELRQHQ